MNVNKTQILPPEEHLLENYCQQQVKIVKHIQLSKQSNKTEVNEVLAYVMKYHHSGRSNL